MIFMISLILVWQLVPYMYLQQSVDASEINEQRAAKPTFKQTTVNTRVTVLIKLCKTF